MKEKYALENFSENQIDELVDFEKKVFPGEGWNSEYYKKAISESPSVIKVVREKGRIIGYFYDAVYQIDFPDGTKSIAGEIASIAVDKEYRGKGLSERLLEKAIHELEEMRSPRIVLFTKTNNRAMQGLARKMGFKITGYYQDFYEEGKDAFLMELSRN